MRESGELNAEKNIDGAQKSTVAGKENIEMTRKVRQDVPNDSRITKHV